MSSVVKNPSSNSNVSFSSYCESRVLITLRILCTISHIGWYRLWPSCRCISFAENVFLVAVNRWMAVNQYIRESLLPDIPCIVCPYNFRGSLSLSFLKSASSGACFHAYPRLPPFNFFPSVQGGEEHFLFLCRKKSFLSLCSLSKSCVSYRNLSGDDWRVVIGGGGDGEGDNAKQKAASDSEAA